MVTIRPEQLADHCAVQDVNREAFNRTKEADLVEKLRAGSPDLVSLIALEGGRVVGHALFTPVTIQASGGEITGMGLGPVAVLPEHQRKGVGSALIEVGLEALRQRGCPFIVVLGHPAYYPRFGFLPASQNGILCQWPGVPDNVFMALVLDRERMKGISGIARYRDEFNSPTIKKSKRHVAVGSGAKRGRIGSEKVDAASQLRS